MTLCAVALSYQCIPERTHNNAKVIAVLVPYCKGDDEFDLRAKAERYTAKHRADEVEGMRLVAWEISVEEEVVDE